MRIRRWPLPLRLVIAFLFLAGVAWALVAVTGTAQSLTVYRRSSRQSGWLAAVRDVTQRRIVDAPVDLIEDEHPLETSMAAVAQRAGISEPTLYRHFPIRRDLFAALAGREFPGAVSAEL